MQLKRERNLFIKKLIYKVSFLDGYIQIQKRSTINLMFKRSHSFGYISQIHLPNSSPLFIAQKLSMKTLVLHQCLALILSEEISDEMYSSLYKYKKRFTQNGAGSIPIGMPFVCFIVTFLTLKWQFSNK